MKKVSAKCIALSCSIPVLSLEPGFPAEKCVFLFSISALLEDNLCSEVLPIYFAKTKVYVSKVAQQDHGLFKYFYFSPLGCMHLVLLLSSH